MFSIKAFFVKWIHFSGSEYAHVYDAERAWHEHLQRMKEIERR